MTNSALTRRRAAAVGVAVASLLTFGAGAVTAGAASLPASSTDTTEPAPSGKKLPGSPDTAETAVDPAMTPISTDDSSSTAGDADDLAILEAAIITPADLPDGATLVDEDTSDGSEDGEGECFDAAGGAVTYAEFQAARTAQTSRFSYEVGESLVQVRLQAYESPEVPLAAAIITDQPDVLDCLAAASVASTDTTITSATFEPAEVLLGDEDVEVDVVGSYTTSDDHNFELRQLVLIEGRFSISVNVILRADGTTTIDDAETAAAAFVTTMRDRLPADDATSSASTEMTPISTPDSTTSNTATAEPATPGTTTAATMPDGSPLPAPSLEPTGLGADVVLDEIAQRCYDGGMDACDNLFYRSELGSVYESFGDTCAGRQTGGDTHCSQAFGPGVLLPAAPETPAATSDPTGLGDVAEIDALAQRCADGIMDACDVVFMSTSQFPEYQPYGDTCGGRQPESPFDFCVDAFPPQSAATSTATTPGTTPGTVGAVGAIPAPTQQPTGLGTIPALDALAQSCYDGDMAACDDLYRQSPPDSAYKAYADTCAGRQPEATNVYCADQFGS